jgi:hypothetical protein
MLVFTNIPLDVALQIIRKKVHKGHTLAEQPILKVEAIMKLLTVCFRTTYFQVDDKFFQQKAGMSMGSSLYHPSLVTCSWENDPWHGAIQTIAMAPVVSPHWLDRLRNILHRISSPTLPSDLLWK